MIYVAAKKSKIYHLVKDHGTYLIYTVCGLRADANDKNILHDGNVKSFEEIVKGRTGCAYCLQREKPPRIKISKPEKI